MITFVIELTPKRIMFSDKDLRKKYSDIYICLKWEYTIL